MAKLTWRIGATGNPTAEADGRTYVLRVRNGSYSLFVYNNVYNSDHLWNSWIYSDVHVKGFMNLAQQEHDAFLMRYGGEDGVDWNLVPTDLAPLFPFAAVMRPAPDG